MIFGPVGDGFPRISNARLYVLEDFKLVAVVFGRIVVPLV